MEDGHARKIANALVNKCFSSEADTESMIVRRAFVEGFVQGWETREKIITREDVTTWPLKLMALGKGNG